MSEMLTPLLNAQDERAFVLALRGLRDALAQLPAELREPLTRRYVAEAADLDPALADALGDYLRR